MIRKINRKSMKIVESGRSTDYLSPSFGHGCLYSCHYCYMRRNIPHGLNVAQNPQEILTAIDNHVSNLQWPKIPNQTHEKYWTYDISCNEDFALHHKYHDWEMIFDFFKNHPRAMGSFATKYIPTAFLNFNPKKKMRIRFSLMPVEFNRELEPHTTDIGDRIRAIKEFHKAGYDVHVNFSPIIVWQGWLKYYESLFHALNQFIPNEIKHEVKAECIFLTHNEKLHQYNLDHGVDAEKYLWNPELQEEKISQVSKGTNIRYKHTMKKYWISDFVRSHYDIIPWNKIRYIF